MKKSNSKNDFKNLKIKRESSNQNLTNKQNNVLSSPRNSTQNSFSSSLKKNSSENSFTTNTTQNSPVKVNQNDFRRDMNFYMRQSSKPWAEIL